MHMIRIILESASAPPRFPFAEEPKIKHRDRRQRPHRFDGYDMQRYATDDAVHTMPDGPPNNSCCPERTTRELFGTRSNQKEQTMFMYVPMI